MGTSIISGPAPRPPNPNATPSPMPDESEASWRAYTRKGAQTWSPGGTFDPSTVYDPTIASLDKQRAAVQSGNADWSMGRIDSDYANRMASPEHQRLVEAARQQWMDAQSGATDKAVNDFSTFANEQGEKLRNVQGDQGDIDRYYKEADEPIQSSYYQAADQTAAALARSGLGNSGINVANSAQLSNNKAALESSAMRKATDMAIQKQRQGLLDEFTTKANAMQTDLQNKGIDISSVTAQAIARMQTDTQLQMLKEQMDANASAGWGQLAGAGIQAAMMAGMFASDEGLKENIERLPVEAIPGVQLATWTWKDSGERGYGVVAQDLAKVAPDLVEIGPDGFMRVNYRGLALRGAR